MARGTSFDRQSPEVSTLRNLIRNLISVALRASGDICILSKHSPFIFLQVVCKPHLEKCRPWDVGDGAVGMT